MGRSRQSTSIRGRHALGRHALGRHALGRHALGRHALGRHALGRHAFGRLVLWVAAGLLSAGVFLTGGCGLEKKKGATGPIEDRTAPGRVGDLGFSLVGPSAVTLAWTATGDDGSLGRADSTEIRWAEATITEATWDAATPLTGVPPPGLAGGSETFSVTGLTTGTRYFFALRVWDEAGHAGPISNCADAMPSELPSPQFSGEVTLSATRIQRGMGVVLTCAVRNSGATAHGGQIHLGFPGLSEPGDSSLVWASGGDDGPGERTFVRGDSIADSQCAPMESGYLTLEYQDSGWEAGELNPVQITIVPREVGEFILELRASLKASAADTLCDWIGAVPPNGEAGFVDQQGWPVHRFMITVDDDEVPIAAGDFSMGSPAEEPGRRDDELAHAVTLTRGFHLSAHEVTQAEWSSLMGWNESAFSGPNRPVEQVTWFDCVLFCNRKSSRAGLAPVYTIRDERYTGNHLVAATVEWQVDAAGYRLPTEAEWEYACRAGSTTAFCNGGIADLYCGDNPALSEVGWFCGNSGGRTHDVAGLDANAWGLCDMHGNVWEWCWDWAAAYPEEPATDPTGPANGTERVHRNGGWFQDAQLCRSAARSHGEPGTFNSGLGFRVAHND